MSLFRAGHISPGSPFLSPTIASKVSGVPNPISKTENADFNCVGKIKRPGADRCRHANSFLFFAILLFAWRVCPVSGICSSGLPPRPPSGKDLLALDTAMSPITASTKINRNEGKSSKLVTNL